MAFRMKSKLLRGPGEVLCGPPVHLPGLLCPLSFSFTCSALLLWALLHTVCFGWKISLHLVLSNSCFGSLLFVAASSGRHWDWVTSPSRALPAQPCPSPVTFSCNDLVISFPLATETVLVPFSAVSLAPRHIPDTWVVSRYSLTKWITYLLKCSKKMRLVEVPMMVVRPPIVAA